MEQNCRRNKDLLQLQLLLTYFQNGITEPWERVPSVFAIFAAEASFILLDPRQNHFLTINKLLMHSPNMNFKVIIFLAVVFICCVKLCIIMIPCQYTRLYQMAAPHLLSGCRVFLCFMHSLEVLPSISKWSACGFFSFYMQE